MQIETKELRKRLLIADASFLTLKEKLALLNSANSAESLAKLSVEQLSYSVGRTLRTRTWNGIEQLKNVERSMRLIDFLKIGYTFYNQDDYPPMLREMKDPPFVLFYRGALDSLSSPCVSVVGTRRANQDARKNAELFSKEASDDGTVVVSGLAFGIDICAHRGALSGVKGCTVAVLPSGIDTIVPSSHTRVAAKIIEQGGAIVSEYAPGTPALAFRFVQRNRIIAALSPATVVIQAPAGSGAMITASLALDYNRDVLFHKTAFSENSELLNKSSIERIKLQKNAENKLKNSPESYVSDGAPVISSYAEYKICRAAAPGKFCRHNEKKADELLEKSLFEDLCT